MSDMCVPSSMHVDLCLLTCLHAAPAHGRQPPLLPSRTFMSATSLITPRSDLVSSLASFLLCGSSCSRSSIKWRDLQRAAGKTPRHNGARRSSQLLLSAQGTQLPTSSAPEGIATAAHNQHLLLIAEATCAGCTVIRWLLRCQIQPLLIMLLCPLLFILLIGFSLWVGAGMLRGCPSTRPSALPAHAQHACSAREGPRPVQRAKHLLMLRLMLLPCRTALHLAFFCHAAAANSLRLYVQKL